LREHEEAFRGAGARLAAVGLGDRAYARAFRDETGIGFPLLIDEQRRAYRAVGLRKASLLHLLRRDNMTARTRAKQAGHRQHRLGRDPLQLGGSFVFAPGNVVRFAHVSETFGDNASPESLLEAVRAPK
jgi:alkyl-hydroperoxide reductase/thiol specific antioxidant family protein